MGDLYYLPIRLSKLLGWAGYAIHARFAVGLDAEPASARLADLFVRVFETYSLSLVAMSDGQAPYVMAALTASARVGLNDDAERLLGHMFASAVSCGGQVARANLDSSKVLGYLVARSNHFALPSAETVAQPTEFVIALLRLSRLFDLTDEFDSSLHLLDHLALNAYLPEDYGQFGAEQMVGGTNAMFQVGHDFWRVSDLEAAWPTFPVPDSSGTAMASLLACLLFPDRSPWFLLPLPSLLEGSGKQ